MNSWTVPTKFGGPGVGLVRSAGLVFHFMAEEAEVCAKIAEAIDLFARDCLGFDDSTVMAVATPSSRARPRKLGSLNAASLGKLFRPDEAVSMSAVGLSTLSVDVARSMPSGDRFLISFTVAKSGGDLADIERLLEQVREFSKTVEVVSGGLDLVHSFDWQNEVLFPKPRSGSWPTYFEQGLCCGYYWLTLLGPSLREKLGDFPDDVDVTVVEGPDLLEIRLSEDPFDDERVGEVLPLVRSWLRPVRSGWYTHGRLSTDLRCYEGPMVPYEQAHYVRRLYEGIVDPLDPERMTPIEDEFDLDVPIDGVLELQAEFSLLDEKFRDFAEPGIIAAVSALTRGIDESWLPYEPLKSWHVDGLQVNAVGSAQAVRALLLIVDSLHRKFGAPVRDPANVVSIESVSVTAVG